MSRATGMTFGEKVLQATEPQQPTLDDAIASARARKGLRVAVKTALGLDPEAGMDGRDGRNGKDGERGERGPEGPEGPMGPMPAHRWVEGTKLQLEQAPGGEWGKAVDLKGEKGEPGQHGAGGGIIRVEAPAPAPAFSYMPGGW